MIPGRNSRIGMYYQYFGLSEAPFSIAVNPRYLFMSPRHRDALAHLLYGVGQGGGFILLTGEVGTGKTTINRCLLEQLPSDTDIAIILNPALNAMELLATACDELGIAYDADNHTLKTLTDKLHNFLLKNHANRRKTVLLIDEAQHLDFEVLEQVRLLTNLETNSEKLLQIILIGQPELAQLLAQPQLRQLNQRITARYNLAPLDREETSAYIHHRLQVAGMAADREVFPPRVVRGIYRLTRGIPRLINVLCDRILLGAYGRNKARADMSMLRLAAREVMGEEGNRSVSLGSLRPALLAVAVALAGLCAWWLLESSVLRETQLTTQQVPTAKLSNGSPRSESPFAEGTATSVSKPPPAEIAPPYGNAGGTWLLQLGEAETHLWALNTDLAQPAETCLRLPDTGPACIEGKADTWDQVEGFDRPLMLDMITPERFSAAVIVLGVEGREAWVLSREGLVRVSLNLLGRQWSGRYRFLWHPPAGFERPLSEGDRGPAVEQIARLFARLDGQQTPLTRDRFNSKLEQRVRVFQGRQGLEDDGVVGVQTLLKLNALLGIDTTAAVARARVDARSAEVVQR